MAYCWYLTLFLIGMNTTFLNFFLSINLLPGNIGFTPTARLNVGIQA